MNPIDDLPGRNDDAERALSLDDLESLPLGYQTVWEKPVLSRDVLQAITVDNTTLRSSHAPQGCGKPISKILYPSEGEGL
jgi:hypothetical protein